MQDPYPKHGRRWTWRCPLRWVCRCGLAAYPCLVEKTWAQPEPVGDPERLYADGLAYVKSWQTEQRRRWRGGDR